MAEEALSHAGLYLDSLNKIRLLEPEGAQQTNELKNECKEFVDKILEFQKIVQAFTEKFDELSQLVEKEKIKAIGSRNAAKSMMKQIDGQKLQLQALFQEKLMELDRLRKEYDSLVKKEAEQTDSILQFTTHRWQTQMV